MNDFGAGRISDQGVIAAAALMQAAAHYLRLPELSEAQIVEAAIARAAMGGAPGNDDC